MHAAVTRELEGHHRRCLPALARLGMLAGAEGEDPFTPGPATEIALLMEEVQRELGDACRILTDRTGGRKGPLASFLSCRQTRLEVAAACVKEAVRDADRHALRRGLQRFRALVLATWTVQRSVVDHVPVALVVPPQGRRSRLVMT